MRSYVFFIGVPSLVALGFAACAEDEPATTTDLQMWAFPAEVSPGGEATIAVQLGGACVNDSGSKGKCSLCVSLAPGAAQPGDLYAPAYPGTVGTSTATTSTTTAESTTTSSSATTSTTPPTTTVLAFPSFRGPSLVQMVYRAPASPVEQVLSAVSYKGDYHCDGALPSSVSVVAQTSVRILVQTPSSSDDAGDAGSTTTTGTTSTSTSSTSTTSSSSSSSTTSTTSTSATGGS